MALAVESEPAEVGLDAGRLRRLSDHLERAVDKDQLPGCLVAVARRGKVAHLSLHGRRVVEDDLPVEPDTLYRIYSMTKPITAVATMALFEEGAFRLTDPLADYLPAFADMRVYTRGSAFTAETVPLAEPIRIWHLLTHTAGLGYGVIDKTPVGQLYINAGIGLGQPHDRDLAGYVDLIASLPLQYQPGTSQAYSVASDVLARFVEVVSGTPYDELLRTRIFEPLGMSETAYWVPAESVDRLAANYLLVAGAPRVRFDDFAGSVLTKPRITPGGHGLVSTALDYHRFCQMLVNGGELDGARILGPRTLAYMTRNHLPGGHDIDHFDGMAEPRGSSAGVGFGLGFAVSMQPEQTKVPMSPGEFSWGGAAGTAFWVDPLEQLTVVFMTNQVMQDTSLWPNLLHQLVHQTIVD